MPVLILQTVASTLVVTVLALAVFFRDRLRKWRIWLSVGVAVGLSMAVVNEVAQSPVKTKKLLLHTGPVVVWDEPQPVYWKEFAGKIPGQLQQVPMAGRVQITWRELKSGKKTFAEFDRVSDTLRARRSDTGWQVFPDSAAGWHQFYDFLARTE